MNPKELRELVDSRVADRKVRKRDAELFHEFISEYSVLESLRDRTIEKWVFGFSGLCQLLYKHVGKTTDQLTNEDAITFIRSVQSSSWAEDTRTTRWKQWTNYMRWLHKRHGPLAPKCQELFIDRDTKYSYKMDANRIKRKDVPTREDVLKIINAEAYDVLKTFYAVVFEGGLPFAEASTLQFQDLEAIPHGRGYNVRVREGKNSNRIRTVPLIELAVGYCDKWVRLHPNKQPNDLLFLMPDGKPLQNPTVNKRLKFLAKSLGIQKHITVHCFRHARSTELCSMLTEFEMNRMFGWVQGSKQPQRYIRTAAIDVRRKLLHAYGYESMDVANNSLRGKLCPRCNQSNTEDANRCDVCSAPMDPMEYNRLLVNAEAQEALVERLIKDKWKNEWEKFKELAKEEVISTNGSAQEEGSD